MEILQPQKYQNGEYCGRQKREEDHELDTVDTQKYASQSRFHIVQYFLLILTIVLSY
jgi:hypothetical protein